MRHEYIFIWHLAWLFFLLHLKTPRTDVVAEETANAYSRGCSDLRCEKGSRCIKRRFWCKNPPCPGMLYCSKSRKETLKGPPTCDTVRCNQGHTCIVKVRGCRWDKMCQQQIARCISEREYYEGAASCAGFKCPSGKRCILRESHCLNPPCKLIRSCAEALDARTWFDECRSLNCTSEYECFLRKPDNNCLDPQCTHTPDCTVTTEDELISKYCHGWICPRAQKCIVRIIGSCKGFNCIVERSCRVLSNSSAMMYMNDKVVEESSTRGILTQMETKMIRQEMENRRMNTRTSHPVMERKPTLVATQRRSTRRTTTFSQREAEVPPTQQQQQRVTTTKSNLIAGQSSTNWLYSTIPYPRFQRDRDKLSTTSDNALEITFDLPSSAVSDSAFWTTPSADDGKIESTASRDTNKLEVLKKFYITSDDALPLPVGAVLEGINLVGQGYPIWIRNAAPPYPSISLEAKNENAAGWGYHAPQEPYKILLPPYEPVFLVRDTRRRGQFFPFFTFDYPSDEASLISLPEITAGDITENSKINDVPTTIVDEIDDAIGSHTNSSTTIKIENSTTNHFNDSSSDYANTLTTEKTSTPPSNISNKELDNYYDVIVEE